MVGHLVGAAGARPRSRPSAGSGTAGSRRRPTTTSRIRSAISTTCRSRRGRPRSTPWRSTASGSAARTPSRSSAASRPEHRGARATPPYGPWGSPSGAVPSEGWRGTFHPVTVQVGERPEGPLTTPARATSGRSRLDDLLLWGGIATVGLLTLLTAANRAPYPPLLFALIVAIAAAAFGVHAARGALRRARTYRCSRRCCCSWRRSSPRRPPRAACPGAEARVPAADPGHRAHLRVDRLVDVGRAHAPRTTLGLAGHRRPRAERVRDRHRDRGDALDAFLDVGDALLILSSPRSSSRSRRSAPSRPARAAGRSDRWPRATSSRLASAAWASRDSSWRWVSTTPSSAWVGGARARRPDHRCRVTGPSPARRHRGDDASWDRRRPSTAAGPRRHRRRDVPPAVAEAELSGARATPDRRGRPRGRPHRHPPARLHPRARGAPAGSDPERRPRAPCASCCRALEFDEDTRATAERLAEAEARYRALVERIACDRLRRRHRPERAQRALPAGVPESTGRRGQRLSGGGIHERRPPVGRAGAPGRRGRGDPPFRPPRAPRRAAAGELPDHPSRRAD